MKEWCNVLIVDDEKLIRQGIINFFDWEKEGFQIVGEAANGKEALELISKNEPHIVMTDIVMPVMDGIDLVKRVKRDFPEVEIIVLSSFEKFEYVRSTFHSGVADYILKPRLNEKDLLKTLSEVRGKIPALAKVDSPSRAVSSISDQFEKILDGHAPLSQDDTGERRFPKGPYRLAVITPIEEQDVHRRKQRLDEREQAITGIDVVCSIEKEGDAVLLLSLEGDVSSSMKQAPDDFLKGRDGHALLVSSPFSSIYGAKEVYERDIPLLKQYSFYLPDTPLLIYDELPKTNEGVKTFDLNHFIELCKGRKFVIGFQYLLDYVEYMSTRYTQSSTECKAFLGNIIFNMIVLMGNLKYDVKELEREKYHYFATINAAKNVREATDCFYQFLEVTKQIISVYSNEGSSNIQKMLAYIEEHHSEPLSLSQLANYFHFNPSYLSAYFRQHHDEGFSEYLNKVRIRKAQEWLKSSTIPISEIYALVGYSDHSYFCKVFKKRTGMPPSRYRRENAEHHETHH
ncbi:response regulator transcription factor [Halalkalibacterium halodurans]|uniref:response regulator transcription factor n=1 Tax=Halalkalibacterium halodurans TaxID=86665 RepID=UPI002E23343C|nr:response regulator transcription factor [Halalkalibacterium halodurans]